MTTTTTTTTATLRDTSRLLAVADNGGGPDLDTHLQVHGPAPQLTRAAERDAVSDALSRCGLTGRGGAGFATARKVDLLARQRHRPLLLVNAMEGEPASAKDRVLLERSPHLVLDGAQVAASLVRASRIVLCVPAEHGGAAHAAHVALAERARRHLDPVRMELAAPPARYAAGEESALADWVAGGSGLPTFRPDKGQPMTVRRSPVLVQNAETLAHVALVARHGDGWFRSVGLPEAAGTTLVTVAGAVERPGVMEVELGTPVGRILDWAGLPGPPGGVLLGGYGGAWIDGSDLDVPFAPAALRQRGAAVGAGVIGVLSAGACGVAETARLVAYLADESAGQCGPCMFGLPAVAEDLDRLAVGAADPALLERLRRRLEVIPGRGACGLPDGAVRLAQSALRVFGSDVANHARRRPCPGWAHGPTFPTPGVRRMSLWTTGTRR